MSLRAKIVLSVLAVNAAVTALLSTFFLLDLRGKESELEAQEALRVEERVEDLKRSFGHLFTEDSLVLELENERTARPQDILQRLWRHPARSWIEDGLVIDRYIVNARESTDGGPEVEVLPTNVYLNLTGAKYRSEDFDLQHAKAMIDRAIRERRVISEADWIAAPIRLKSLMKPAASVDSSGQPWGGGYFLLRRPTPAPEWTPGYGASLFWVMGAGTLLLVTLTVLLLDRWILRPIGRLARGAERVAEGRYGEPVPSEGAGDEVGRLVTTFNSMMAQVGQTERELSERVEHATQRAQESRRGLVIAQRLAATGTLASGIAHEINNPLGGLLNATDYLRRSAAQETDLGKQKRYLELIDDGLRRIREIVRRVLAFSPRQVEPSAVSVQHLVQQAVALAEHRASKSGVTIQTEGEDAQILVVPGEIQQVVLNLLLNACDAMEGQGGTVLVQVRRTGEDVELAVRDDGPGMSAGERERVFDLFYTTKEVGRGTGLGLSVAHHIVDQHGGHLTVESEPGQGSTFTLRLPMASSG